MLAMARVLLIGTDPVTRLILEQAGHTVRIADNFCQAHEHLRHSDADVVLTDLHMPDSESLRQLAYLHTAFPLVKILVIVDDHDTVDFLSVRMSGADDVLRQPLTSKTLLDAVKQALVEEDTP